MGERIESDIRNLPYIVKDCFYSEFARPDLPIDKFKGDLFIIFPSTFSQYFQ